MLPNSKTTDLAGIRVHGSIWQALAGNCGPVGERSAVHAQRTCWKRGRIAVCADRQVVARSRQCGLPARFRRVTPLQLT